MCVALVRLAGRSLVGGGRRFQRWAVGLVVVVWCGGAGGGGRAVVAAAVDVGGLCQEATALWRFEVEE